MTNKDVPAIIPDRQMDILKFLIVGWSIFWAATLLALSQLKAGDLSAILTIPATQVYRILWVYPIFALAGWILGCVVAIGLARVLKGTEKS